MATTYFAWTLPVTRDDVGLDYRSLDDVAPLMQSEVAIGRVLASASRNDWLACILEHIAPVFGAFSIKFVRDVVSKFDPASIEEIIRDVETLLASAESNPSVFASAIGCNDPREVLDALNSSKPADNPTSGPEGEEEGDGPRYLFAYLKSLHTLLVYARDKGLFIMHVRHEHEARTAR